MATEWIGFGSDGRLTVDRIHIGYSGRAVSEFHRSSLLRPFTGSIRGRHHATLMRNVSTARPGVKRRPIRDDGDIGTDFVPSFRFENRP